MLKEHTDTPPIYSNGLGQTSYFDQKYDSKSLSVGLDPAILAPAVAAIKI